MKKILKIAGIIIAAIIVLVVAAVGVAEVYDLYLAGHLTGNAIPNIIVTNDVKNKNLSEFTFPVGYETFHENEDLNFLLNRTYSMGYATKEDMQTLGKRMKNLDQWKSELINLAEEAITEKRYLNAAFYYRIAEFYTLWDDPDKTKFYNLFIKYFYKAIDPEHFTINKIPYEGSFLTAMKVESEVEKTKGTIILHAGYDGFKEEMYSAMRYFSCHGYDVINFECPWMVRGEEESKIPFSYKWETIISRVIDYYQLEEVTLIGFSFGGWLALRAAAFESRIKRVVASSVSFDVNQYPNILMQLITSLMMLNKEMVNNMLTDAMKKDIQQNWFFDHLMHVTHTTNPYDASLVFSQINEQNLHSELVKQDVLILTGRNDRLVPFKMHNMQVIALVNAKSITPLVFDDTVHASHHCQFGNLELAFSAILDWIKVK